jgi:beta-carotene hydroxylase
MLRYRSDLQSLAYMVTATALIVWQWSLPEFSIPLFLLANFMAVTITVIAHNHNHLRMWRSRTANAVTDYWLTLLYGFPAFAWIPTHNMNHHKFTNREGDYTITYRHSERNNLVTLLTYPTISSYHQQKPIRDYLRDTWQKQRPRFWFAILQYAALGLFVGGALLLDWKKALLYIVVPQQFGLFVVLVFNYLQHVHADEESEWDHSRNFVSPVLNTILLNNGLHTAHHHSPGTHWSRLREAHAKIAPRIDPVLNEKSFWWMLLRVFILAPFVPSLRSRSLRLARLEREAEAARSAPAVASVSRA